MNMPAANQAAFDRLSNDYLRKEQWTDIEIFTLIGNFADAEPVIARALSFHTRDVLHEAGENEIDYTDVACEVYRRTFFDPEQATKYGTEHFTANGEILDHFVSYLVTMFTAQDAGANVIPFAPPKYRM
jgi:hypothetical protein